MAKKKEQTIEDDAQDMLDSYEIGGEVPKEVKEKIKKGKKLQGFIDKKKKSFKETKYRKKYDGILDYMEKNLVNTSTYNASMPSASTNVAYSFIYDNGSYTQIPMINRNVDNEAQRIPTSNEPIAFSKIMTAVSTLAGKVPDATVLSSDKIYSRTAYEMWKRTWTNPLANGLNTLQFFYQNVLGSGFGAYRVFPKKIEHESKGVPRILFDDIYRQAIDPRRIWIGSSVNIYDRWSKGECVYEIDQEKESFCEKYEDAKYFQLEYANTNTDTEIDVNQQSDFIVIRYYEDPIKNKYMVACGNYPIYEGEMPNEEGFGHVVWANCFSNNPSDPYGVGLVEMMRGNIEMYNYIMGLSAEQVEAEISPLLFGTNTGVGEMTYRRGPNVINPKGQGTTIDIIKTSGNVQQSIIFADSQLQKISDNTGINDILAGSAGEGTLGATVIMKEAALSRLIIPRNNVVSCLEYDAYATWSWVRQIYSVEKVILLNNSEEVSQFIKLNPGYFVVAVDENIYLEDPMSSGGEAVEEPEEKGKKKYTYSKKLALNFDIKMDEEKPAEEDTVEELTNDYLMPSSELFTILEKRGHLSDRIQFIIDPTSMLLPSDEINKQRITQIYEMVTPATAQIIQMESQMPDLARTMMMQLEHILDVNKESVYDWVPKDVYDRIMKPKPPMPTPTQMVEGGASPLEGALAPQPMGNAPSAMGPMTQEFKSTSTPFNDSMNASIGRGAKANLEQ
jgi:hypothetical protein